MTMYQVVAYLSSSGFDRSQITDIIHTIIDETLYIQGKEARWYARCQINDYYNYKEKEKKENESDKR